MLVRTNDLNKDRLRSPFKGIGKPEPLKGNYAGCWSRRINEEHRLVYAVRTSGCIFFRPAFIMTGKASLSSAQEYLHFTPYNIIFPTTPYNRRIFPYPHLNRN